MKRCNRRIDRNKKYNKEATETVENVVSKKEEQKGSVDYTQIQNSIDEIHKDIELIKESHDQIIDLLTEILRAQNGVNWVVYEQIDQMDQRQGLILESRCKQLEDLKSMVSN